MLETKISTRQNFTRRGKKIEVVCEPFPPPRAQSRAGGGGEPNATLNFGNVFKEFQTFRVTLPARERSGAGGGFERFPVGKTSPFEAIRCREMQKVADVNVIAAFLPPPPSPYTLIFTIGDGIAGALNRCSFIVSMATPILGAEPEYYYNHPSWRGEERGDLKSNLWLCKCLGVTSARGETVGSTHTHT